MQFYYTLSSPYAKNVRTIIALLGISDQVQFIESHPFKDEEAFLTASPLGKVPCLVDNGETIVDSEVICDYLDANYTGGELFNPIYADWRLKSLLSVCSGLIDSLVSRRIEETRKNEDSFSKFWWERQNKAITRTLGYIESKLSLLPETLTILQICLMSALEYLDFRHRDIEWRKNYPELEKFYQIWSGVECFQTTLLKD
ncbi:glutathione S-transferase family protein [Aliikangiella sp. G2MR2-5]|uniref:glutathione S-transferase family protein n=1 Tax=Aliikangiella sp. G2MR2-5 TaxID=2788943 RepID=UPI0018AB5C98|nr:glutathione S-transferase family protein [Aliikangiella sp. G2MR2-5]